MLNNKFKKYFFYAIFILSIFILIFFYLQNKLAKTPVIWQFDRLIFSAVEYQNYQKLLQEYNNLEYYYKEKKHIYLLNEYDHFDIFKYKFKNFEQLNNYLGIFNNTYERNLKIDQRDIIYNIIRPDTKFHLKYYGNDIEKFNEFVEFMNNSIKEELLIKMIDNQKIINENFIFSKKVLNKKLNDNYLFYRIIYLYNLSYFLNLKFIPTYNNDKNLIMGKCFYYLGYQHKYSEISQMIEIISKNQNYIFDDFNKCFLDSEKKDIERLRLNLNDSFLRVIMIANKKLIHADYLKNKSKVTYMKVVLNILTMLLLIVAAFIYRNQIYLFFKKFLKK